MKETLERILVSPVSGEPLWPDQSTYRSPSGETFPVVNGIPVLISQSSRDTYEQDLYKIDFLYLYYFDSCFLKSLLKKLKIPRGSLLVDVGGGEGFYSKCFADAGLEVLTADFSKYLLEKGKRRFPQLNFIAADANSVPLADHSADILFCSGLSLFNTKDLHAKRPLVNHLMSKIKPGGVFIFMHSTNLTGKPMDGWYPVTFADLDELFAGLPVIGRWFVPRLFAANLLGRFCFTRGSSSVFARIVRALSFLHSKVRGRIVYVIRK